MKTKEKVKLKTQYKRQNEFIKENYDRVSVTLPKGTKDRIQATGESINGFISRLVSYDLDKAEAANRQQEGPDQGSDLPEFMRD